MDKKLSAQEEKNQRILQKIRDMGMTPIEDIKSENQLTLKPSLPVSPSVSKTESAIRGAAQGLAFGFPDEATAFLRNIAGKTPFLPEKPYEQALQESRQAYKQAQEANPITYTGAEIAGGVLPALIPTGATQATGAVNLGRLAAIGAGTGALSGLGFSEGQNIGEIAKDTAIGAGLGGALPMLGRGISKGVQAIKPATDTSIKAGISALTGKTLPYLEKIENQPEKVKRVERIFDGTAKEEIEKLANEFSVLVDKNPFGRKAELLSRRAKNILKNEADNIKIDKNYIINYLENKANSLSPVSEVEQMTKGNVLEKLDAINQSFPSELNGLKSKELLTLIDKDIKALSPKSGSQVQLPTNAENKLDFLRELRKTVDAPLKQQSPRYAEAMKPTADATNVSDYLQKLTISQFGGKEASATKAKEYIKRKLNEGDLIPSETEFRTLNLMKEELKNPRYNNYPGISKLRDTTQTIDDLNFLKEMQATGAIGSNITNRMLASGTTVGGFLGSALGGITGGPSGAATGTGVGTALGALGGALLAPKMEREGGKIAQRLLEKTKNIRTPIPISEPTQRGFATQQGAQKGLLDQFLSENRNEVERRQAAKTRWEQDVTNRVK